MTSSSTATKPASSSKMDKMGTTAIAPKLRNYDAKLLSPSGKEQAFTFGDLKARRNLPGMLGAMFASNTDQGVLIDYALSLQSMFGLGDDECFIYAFTKGGEVLRSRPLVKVKDGSLVLSIPRKMEPVSLSGASFRVMGFNIIVDDLIIPFSLDMDLVQEGYGSFDDAKENRTNAEYGVAQSITAGDYSFVRDWEVPGSGKTATYCKANQMALGIYACNSMELENNKGETKDGKKYNINSGKLWMTSLEGDRFGVDFTESATKALLSEFANLSATLDGFAFSDYLEVCEAKKIVTSKPFLILIKEMRPVSGGIQVVSQLVLPTQLPELADAGIKKFFAAHGTDADTLYQQWSGAIAAPVEAAVEVVPEPEALDVIPF